MLQDSDQRLFDLAQRKTAARDPGCWASAHSLPVISQGSPSHELLSLLGVLRRPASAADARARAAFIPSPGEIREIYMRYARVARVYHGARFFIVPAGDVTGLQAVAARCIAEERTALQWILRHAGAAARAQKVQLQADYLAWQRYAGAHPEGICLAALGLRAWGGRRGLVDCSHTVVDVERGVANLAGVFAFTYGAVPDEVATVSMRASPGDGSHYAPVTGTVVGNVWTLVPPPGSSFPAAWIWRDASGRIVKAIRWPG